MYIVTPPWGGIYLWTDFAYEYIYIHTQYHITLRKQARKKMYYLYN